LDHWATFFGMTFALNFPLTTKMFSILAPKTTTTSSSNSIFSNIGLIIPIALFIILTIFWVKDVLLLDKLPYNQMNAYFCIVPMTAYLFIRNSTPFLRSYISSFLHMLGKTTLETYLLQHHLWLASNAKQLLVILPDHPKINFFLCTLLFLFASQEIYRLTMSLRGMILPNDFGACVRNLGGMVAVLVVSGLVALFITPFFSFSSFVFSIFFLSATLIYFLDKKLNKFETFAKIHEEDDETKDDEMLEIELGEISSSSKNGQQEIEELSNQKESSAKKTNGDKLLKADPTTMKGYLIKNWKLCLSFLFFVIYLFHSRWEYSNSFHFFHLTFLMFG